MGERSDNPSSEGWRSRSELPEGLFRALDWLKGRLEGPVQIETLADVAGVRPRTLESQFKLYLGTTPLGWVRRLRLVRARQQLLSADATTNVTNVAMATGFTQLGRFATYYRQQFGELPSRTLRTARMEDKAASDLDDEALRLSWRAMTSAYSVGPAACGAAMADVERARELAPQLALPKAIAAWCLSQGAAHNFSRTPQLDRAEAAKLAEETRKLAPYDALALSLCAGALTLTRRLADADRLIERSLAIDPWSPWGWVRRGWLSAYAGDDDGALRELKITLRLMPFEPVRHLIFIGIGCVHFNAGRYERAADLIRDGTAAVPDSFWADRVGVAATALAGAQTEARRAARRLLHRDKNLTVEIAQRAWPFPPSFMRRLGHGLLLAGVPKS